MHNKPGQGIELTSIIGLKKVFVFNIMEIIFITAITVQTIAVNARWASFVGFEASLLPTEVHFLCNPECNSYHPRTEHRSARETFARQRGSAKGIHNKIRNAIPTMGANNIDRHASHLSAVRRRRRASMGKGQRQHALSGRLVIRVHCV